MPNTLHQLHRETFLLHRQDPGTAWQGHLSPPWARSTHRMGGGGPSPAGRAPKAPRSSINGHEGRLWRAASVKTDSRALSPLNACSTRGTSPMSRQASGEGKRHRRLVGMHVMEWTSELTSKHGTHGRAWRRGTRDKGGTTDRGACLGVEIPTIIIFQIQRLLVSEQRNNKFNQRWSLKERK